MTKILNNSSAAQAFRQSLANKTLGFVPTMGNLHAGHLSLIEQSQRNADATIVSIFVNPTQFGENEDLDAYPRTFEEDFEKLQKIGVDAVFYPKELDIYPHGKHSTISIEPPRDMVNILCGANRPTHFQGVATVVAKLLHIVMPNIAVFGEKDFQQLAIIRRLAAELFMEIDIISGEIIREPSGLAMSSRNQYLSDDERNLAANLFKTLTECKSLIVSGNNAQNVLQQGKERLHSQQIDVEYLELRDGETLASNPTNINNGALLIACRIGKTRLIDNLKIQ